jgi:hypothetical protein
MRSTIVDRRDPTQVDFGDHLTVSLSGVRPDFMLSGVSG